MESRRLGHGALVTALGLIFLFTAPAAAADPESLYQEGIVQLKVAKFNRALRAFKAARKQASDPGLRAKVNLYLGITHGVLGNKKKAAGAFRASLEADPGLNFPRAEIKESVIAIYDQARASMKGTLLVKADREGAVVVLDGKEAGKAPLDRELPVGRYTVLVRSADGLHQKEAEALIRSGQRKALELALEFIGARLKVSGSPDGATVTLDGEPAGVLPLSRELKPGKYALQVEAPGHAPERWPLELKPGETRQITARLQAEEKSAPAPVPVPAGDSDAVTDEAGGGFPVWTAVTAGVALAAVGAGIGLAVASDSAWQDLQDAKSGDEFDEFEAQVLAYDAGMAASFAVAGVAAAGSLLIYFLVERDRGGQEGVPNKVSLRPGPGGISLVF